MDPDMPSDRETPEPYIPTAYGDDDDDDDGEDWRRERSPTPLLDSAAESAAKPRKRLIKKSTVSAAEEFTPDFDEVAVRKRKKEKEGGSSRRKEKRPKKDKGSKSWSRGGGSSSRDHEGDPEMKEMWDTIAGGDSEVYDCFLINQSSLLMQYLFFCPNPFFNIWGLLVHVIEFLGILSNCISMEHIR